MAENYDFLRSFTFDGKKLNKELNNLNKTAERNRSRDLGIV